MHNHPSKNIKLAFFINLIFSIIEFVGGIYTNSVAILADAVHDLGDAISLGIAWWFENISGKKRDENFTYGYGRFSLLSALITAIILLSGSIFIIYESINRFSAESIPDPEGMFVLSLFGIIFNWVAYKKLHRGEKMNEKMVSLHLLEDIAGWVLVMIGSVLIKFFYVPYLDPILSLAISSYIILKVAINLKTISKVFLQGKPDFIHLEKLQSSLSKINGVVSVHDLHAWSLDGNNNIMTVHLTVKDNAKKEDIVRIKTTAKKVIQDVKSTHITISIDYESEDCELKDC